MNDQQIRERTRELLMAHMITGRADSVGLDYHYTKPSEKTYPYQYFWDTCFHTFILNALGEADMAKKHLMTLFALQKEDGFVGHMVYWSRLLPSRLTDIFQSRPGLGLFKAHMSALVQPPLVAKAVLRTYEVSQDRPFLDLMLPKLKRYYHWLAENRDFEGKGLLSIISPFESGMDWKPTFDPVVGFPRKKADFRLFWKVVSVDFRNFWHRYDLKKIYQKDYFIVKDAGFNAIYAQNLQAMAELCTAAGDPDAGRYQSLADQVIQQMIAVMYDEKEGAFWDVYGKLHVPIKILTPTIFFPVVLKGMPDAITQRVLDRHFFREKAFSTPFPIPSLAVNDPAFNPNESLYLWRGPTWIMFNWYMHHFLVEKGYVKEAKRLVESIKKLIRKSGFREYYHPFTGEGYGAKHFTWAGLVVDMMNKDESSDQRLKDNPWVMDQINH